MFEKLAASFRSSDTHYRLLVPLLISTMLVQLVTAMVRVTTSYRAVELNLSIVWLGLIVAMLIASAVMGTGHIMLMASQQMLCVRAAGPRSLESVFGNYMVAGAIGQGVGPYVVGWVGGAAAVPPTQLLFTIGAIIAALTFAVVLAIRPGPDKPPALGESEIVPVRQILRIPGLAGVVLAGVILVSASDIIVIYVPLLGAERNIDVHAVGLLLTVRAVFSMVARLFYARAWCSPSAAGR